MNGPSYHDFVIKGGRLVGKFEEIYRRFDDPWDHELLNRYSASRALAIHQLRVLKELNGIKRVLDLGCGKGQFTAEIAKQDLEVTGFDISETAVAKARQRATSACFQVGTLNDQDRILAFRPDVILMSQITWYVLTDLEPFLKFLKLNLPETLLVHVLAIYPPGKQTYGREYFIDLQGILDYFGMYYLEYGEIKTFDGHGDTFFIGSWNPDVACRWKRARPA